MKYPEVYEGNDPFIFVSYAHKDAERVIPLIRGLIDRGYRVWYDVGMKNMRTVEDWPTYIGKHLVKSHCVLAFVSQNAAMSVDCRKELGLSIERKKNPLVLKLEDLLSTNETIGTELQLVGLHSIRYDDYENETAFLDALTEYQALQAAKYEETQLPKYLHLTPEACNRKGQEYQRGEGVRQNWKLAAAWYRRGAEAGHPEAQYNLGWCYDNGKGVPMDWNQALEWYRKAAAQGHRTAMLIVRNAT